MRFNIWKWLSLVPAVFILQFAMTAHATNPRHDELPLWEIGLGVAPITMPSYRGSNTQEIYPVPMPFLDYRGDFLRADREGIRGLIYDSDRVRVDLSGDGAIPSATDEDGPRRGMPDLDPLVEIGPSINIIFHETPRSRLRLRLPVRAAFATDFSSIYRAGWKFHPEITFDMYRAVRGWNVGGSFGPLFADADYHAYYYDVPREFATDFRESYRAGGGYSGTALMLTTSRRFGNTWMGLFVRYDNLSGAVFSDSPLVETKHAFMAGFGIAYIFWQSKTRVPSTRDDFY